MSSRRKNFLIKEKKMLVSFSDLTGYNKLSQSLEDKETFILLAGFYGIVRKELENTEGILVKFIGDAAMIVFPGEKAGEGVNTLRALKEKVDKFFLKNGLSRCKLAVRAHYGDVICAMVDNRQDFFGNNVNIAASLKTSGFTITPQVFRKLAPGTRKFFKKHAPQITYIPVEESYE